VSATELLGRQVGPLPVGAWLAVVGGGLGIGWYARRGGGDDQAADVEPDPYGSLPGGALPPAGATPLPGGGSPAAPGGPDNNVAWGILAVSTLIAAGKPALDAHGAISRFLRGDALYPADRALIDLAISRIGPPPEPVAPVAPAPAPKRPPTRPGPVPKKPAPPKGPRKPAPLPRPTPRPKPRPIPGGGTAPCKPTLRTGSRGSAVREAQTLLRTAGHSPGGVDGIFGPRTLAAVRSFQRAKGLAVDGVIGPRTWYALGARCR